MGVMGGYASRVGGYGGFRGSGDWPLLSMACAVPWEGWEAWEDYFRLHVRAREIAVKTSRGFLARYLEKPSQASHPSHNIQNLLSIQYLGGLTIFPSILPLGRPFLPSLPWLVGVVQRVVVKSGSNTRYGVSA